MASKLKFFSVNIVHLERRKWIIGKSVCLKSEACISVRKGMDYEEEFIVRKSDAPVKKELFNNLLEIIQGHVLTFV